MNRSLSPARSSSPAAIVIDSDHVREPVISGEIARLVPAKGIRGVDLLYGKYRRFSFARHFHAVPAIGIVETGIMRTCWQRGTHEAPAGSVILFNPGDVHAPHPADGAGWSFRMFYLDPDLLAAIAGMCGPDRPLWFVRSFVENAALHSRLSALHRLLENDPDPLASESRLVSALGEIARFSLWTTRAALPDAGASKVERAREYLHTRGAEPVTLRMLSDVADLSPWHLLRSFRARVGMTPHAYHMQIRVERGRCLLASGLSIAEAALQSGFADQSHFTRQFKKFTGVTPGQYC